MYEHSSSSESVPQPLSSVAQQVLLEAARSYLWHHPEPGTISELGEFGDDQFKNEVNDKLRKAGGPDYSEIQLKIDFDEINRLIQEKGAETVAEEEMAKQAEARQAQETSAQLGASATGRFGFLRRRKK